MTSYDQVLRAARSLRQADQERLVRELSGSGSPHGRGLDLPLANLTTPRPHSVAWVKAERGHAVLATETPASDAEIPAGAEAIAGIWADREVVAGEAARELRSSGGAS
jgi:hypothetical protein